eukprot:114296-Chlamydomonas_euryale.AAC.2
MEGWRDGGRCSRQCHPPVPPVRPPHPACGTPQLVSEKPRHIYTCIYVCVLVHGNESQGRRSRRAGQHKRHIRSLPGRKLMARTLPQSTPMRDRTMLKLGTCIDHAR